LLRKIRSAIRYGQVFSSPIEVLKFRRVYKSTTNGEPVHLRVKESNYGVLCRPNTTDAQVLWDVFYRKYAIPPIKLSDDAVILDFGSNVGYTMVHFAFRHPKARIFGFEMDYDNFQLAQKNLEKLTQCKIYHAAVWYRDDQVTYGGEKAWGFRIGDDDNMSNKKTVNALSPESIMKMLDLEKIDYVKMDIEGAEKKILENSEKWITKVKSIKVEVHPPNTTEECVKLLVEKGFNCKIQDDLPDAIIGIR
jgi:FkbM family methyltransferase